MTTNLSSIFWIFERSSRAASERSEEGAGGEVGGEADARRGEAAWRRRCINDDVDVDDDRGSGSAALVDASAVERPAAAAVTRMTAC